eukprot:671058-Pyramimonas_sp.AAC.1
MSDRVEGEGTEGDTAGVEDVREHTSACPISGFSSQRNDRAITSTNGLDSDRGLSGDSFALS